MSLFNALVKTISTKVNNSLYESDIEKSKKRAYVEVGNEIAKAKRSGKYISGRNAYRRKFYEHQKKAKEKKDLRQKFIDNM